MVCHLLGITITTKEIESTFAMQTPSRKFMNVHLTGLKDLIYMSRKKSLIKNTSVGNPIWDKYDIVGVSFDTSNNPNKKFFKPVYIMPDGDVVACDGTHDFDYLYYKRKWC